MDESPVTATDAREELEAAIWRGLKLGGWAKAVENILNAADAYADAVADERIAGRVHSRTIGRERLAAAAADSTGAKQ